MRRLLVLLAHAILVHAMVLGQGASADDQSADSRRSVGSLRPENVTAAPDNPRPAPSGLEPYGRDAYGQGYYHGPPSRRHGPYRPYPYPPYYWRYWYPPPLYIPAEELYGPQALNRFLGLDPRFPFRSNPRVIVVPKDKGDDQDAADKEAARRAANERSLNLAWRFIAFGDAHFGNQKYADAYQRYRKAAQAAPTLADVHFRQGYAMMALGRYEQAAKALKEALKIDPDLARSDFRNDELYADNRAAKAAHLDALAQAAVDKPDDADLLFLVGVFLHFDGQTDRARAFFEEAARLVGPNDAHLKALLDAAEPAREW